MAVFRAILSLVLYTISILALTTDQPPFLKREATTNTTLSLNLIQLASQDGLVRPSLATCPPKRWDYHDGSYDLSIYRGPIHAGTKRKDNPGVSLHNWGVAVDRSITALKDQSERAGQTMFDPIPGGRFHYATSLDRRAVVHHRAPRKLIFEISNRTTELLYIEANVILTGLSEYEQQWKTGSTGRPTDEVRMCRFELRLKDDGDNIFVANGTVSLFIPSGNDGSPISVGPLTSSSPSGYS